VAVVFRKNDFISILPNPAVSFVQLNLHMQNSRGYSYQLFDIHGKLLQAATISGGMATIALNGLQSATYIIRINKDNRETSVFTIIKK